MVDDPSAHPDRFPTEKAQAQERERLFGLIKKLVKWENTNDANKSPNPAFAHVDMPLASVFMLSTKKETHDLRGLSVREMIEEGRRY